LVLKFLELKLLIRALLLESNELAVESVDLENPEGQDQEDQNHEYDKEPVRWTGRFPSFRLTVRQQ